MHISIDFGNTRAHYKANKSKLFHIRRNERKILYYVRIIAADIGIWGFNPASVRKEMFTMKKCQSLPRFVHALLAIYLCAMVYLLFIRNFHFVGGAGYAVVLANTFRPIPFDDIITYATSPV